jgi:hypothetical protein
LQQCLKATSVEEMSGQPDVEQVDMNDNDLIVLGEVALDVNLTAHRLEAWQSG